MRPMKDRKLYNVIFPVWMLWIFPLTWIFVLPANFIIDSLVVVITLKIMKAEEIKKIYKKVIWKVWGFGFLSDFIGVLVLIGAMFIEGWLEEGSSMARWWSDYITGPVCYNAFENPFAFLWVTLAVLSAGIAIYFFNYKISFKKLELEVRTKKKLALFLAVFTAPVLFYLPSALIY